MAKQLTRLSNILQVAAGGASMSCILPFSNPGAGWIELVAEADAAIPAAFAALRLVGAVVRFADRLGAGWMCAPVDDRTVPGRRCHDGT